jgi:hypothetical protein
VRDDGFVPRIAGLPRRGGRAAGAPADAGDRRWRGWEFWPAWAAYAPLVPWIAWLALRHGGPGTVAAANPAFPDGGLVGESKFEILRLLPRRWTVPTVRIAPGGAGERCRAVAAFAELPEVSYPLVLKPDVGQRGAGVRKVHDPREAAAYLRAADYPIVAQPWHPGPFEAGVFYWRHPDAPRGQILSITDKVFPRVVGDGVTTIEGLGRAHPRLARQWTVFRTRHAASLGRVLAPGEVFVLGEVGNHCQGTLFRDGRELWTPALASRIDAIAREVPGFFIGRFDVRYSSRERFMAGEDLAIVELNGVTAEPTDVYDPDRSLWSSYRALAEQWRLVFTLGAANRRRGCRGASVGRLLRLALDHLGDARRFPVSS